MTNAKPGGRNAEVDFRGYKRSRSIHAPVTEPEVLPYSKPPVTGASLCFIGRMLMENRHGPIVRTGMTHASFGRLLRHCLPGNGPLLRALPRSP